MGQIFYACAYDIEARTCCVIGADKFHANCYSHSGAVLAMHYLLRQKDYRVIWGGNEVFIEDDIENFSRKEDLLGISSYVIHNEFDSASFKEKSFYDKAKFIEDNSKLWKNMNSISVLNDSREYFDWDNIHSVKYEGYLLNRTKKLAVNLEDYYTQSKLLLPSNAISAIDLIPVLTETGGGTQIVLHSGVSSDSTEELAGTWLGDLLRIVEVLPEGYTLINCCFAEVRNRTFYCYDTFGVNEDGYLLKDNSGNLFQAAALNPFLGTRGRLNHIKVEKTENCEKFIPAD